EVYRRLVERGLNPTDLQVKTSDGSSQQIIFPGAIVSYRNKELPLELLISQMGVSPEEVLNNSIQNLEFNLADVVRRLTIANKPKVAFIQGHGELDKYETADAVEALSDYYSVEYVNIGGQLNSLGERTGSDNPGTPKIRNKYDAIIIAKPDSAFTEQDKFIIDQFIMYGGRVLWLVDAVFASMDSMQYSDATVGIINDINLSDQLYNYGVRLNTNLVMDLNALPIPLKTGETGGAPQIDYFPWYFFPILNPGNAHPIVKNLNAIKTEFISSIDTLDKKGLKKTVLLASSQYSRTVNTPVFISLGIIHSEPDRRLYNKEHIPVAVLLEGSWESLYNNRIPPAVSEDKDFGFAATSRPGKMIIAGDGDIIKNQLRTTASGIVPYPLGYDRHTGQSFGNKDFILNAMNYLVDDNSLISIRSRELKIRLLDRTKISDHRLFWQLLNILLPVGLVAILGIWMFFYRRRKYAKV
ncbi:MAG: gliding motility-associated ABC transporter substrate-binding protein GldG, partial [Bacteroidetes bacterium]|nr:gliding motility-associated ABC transporter substrate-binding protein GldG [Bacteroidota bacterium]